MEPNPNERQALASELNQRGIDTCDMSDDEIHAEIHSLTAGLDALDSNPPLFMTRQAD